jgi:oligopeptide transport system substrate-binding protein
MGDGKWLIGRRDFSRAALLGAGALSLGTLLSACGGGGRTAGPPVLRRGTANEPRSLDPHYVPGNAGAALMYDMFEGLMAVDAAGDLIPGLAESHTVSPDGLIYTFTLRENLRWSDGTPLTSEDVVYSFRRSVDPSLATRSGRVLSAVRNYRQILRGLIPPVRLAVSGPDPRTVRIEIETPTSYMLDALASFSAAIVPRHAIEPHGERWTTPANIVTSGAYTLAEWIPNTSIRLVKNANYHDAANVAIEEVIFYPVERPATAVTRFRAQELDIVFNIPADQIDSLRSSGYAEQIHSSPSIGVFYVLLNLKTGPTRDVRVREALSLTVDRDLISRQLLRNEGDPAYTIVPAAMPNYEAPPLPMQSMSMDERKARARALLQEAGYPAANPLPITYNFGGQESNRRIAVALQSMWQEIGINVTLENVGGNGVVADARTGNFEAMRYQYYAPFQDPVVFLQLMQSEANVNLSGYANPTFDAALLAADRTLDPAERVRRLQEVERMIMADFPVIPIYYNQRNYLVAPRVQGWVDNVRGEHVSRFLSLAGAES